MSESRERANAYLAVEAGEKLAAQLDECRARLDQLREALEAIRDSKNAHPAWAPEIARAALEGAALLLADSPGSEMKEERP